ncbi:MAG: FliH/SctL family protein, partial [Rhodothermales bacterium]|nr:FliH/SctL family protein [Rhodothermales bacterium]
YAWEAFAAAPPPGEATVEAVSEPEPSADEVNEARLRAVWEAAWEERHEAALAEARETAYEAGHAEGRAAAEEALHAEIEAERATLIETGLRLQTMWQDYVAKCEPLLASLAFEVARQLLAAPLPQDVRAVTTQALARALQDLAERPSVEVTLHPEDLDRLSAYGYLDDLGATHEGLRWKADARLDPGDWVVQTPDAAIRHLKDELLNHLQSRFGLLTALQKRGDGALE